MREKTFLILLLLFFGFNCSAVFALDLLGPPSAGMKQGQFSAGAEYSYSRMNIKLSQGKGGWMGYSNDVLGASNSGKISSRTIEKLSLNKVFANIGYGVTDNWEVFLRLGGVNADFKYKNGPRRFFPGAPILVGDSLFPSGQKVNGDNGFAIGFGTRATFYKKGKLKWGGLFQISWADSDGTQTGVYGPGQGVMTGAEQWSHSVDVEITEIQIALGPTYKLTEGASVYGGPFFHFIDGKVHGEYNESGQIGPTIVDYRSDYSYDIDECSIFGGYIGVQVDVNKNASFNIEYQHTASADAFCMNLVWTF